MAGLEGVVVESIFAGAHNSGALSNDGVLYVWGANGSSQLGTGSDTTPSSVVSTSPLLLIRCSLIFHVVPLASILLLLLLSLTHSLLSTFQPVKIDLPEKVTSAAIGAEHIAAIVESGSLYTWGNNEFGQLGVGYDDVEGVQKVQILSKEFITKVLCGDMVTICLTQSGT